MVRRQARRTSNPAFLEHWRKARISGLVCHIFRFRGHVWTMNIMTMDSAGSDEKLCQLASAGDRDAFSKIVERYQIVICSVAHGMKEIDLEESIEKQKSE
jgi:hypothetical protein